MTQFKSQKTVQFILGLPECEIEMKTIVCAIILGCGRNNLQFYDEKLKNEIPYAKALNESTETFIKNEIVDIYAKKETLLFRISIAIGDYGDWVKWRGYLLTLTPISTNVSSVNLSPYILTFFTLCEHLPIKEIKTVESE